MATTATYKSRTREEIIAWWRKARERKEAFQRETDEIFAKEEMLRKQAAESPLRLRITRMLRITKTSAANRLYDYELHEFYEFPKRRLPIVFTTTNYTNFSNNPMLIQRAPIRIIRIIRSLR